MSTLSADGSGLFLRDTKGLPLINSMVDLDIGIA